VTLILRLAHNYKLLDSQEIKEYISQVVKENKAAKKADIKLLEALISIG
jgi:hypothetical protein